MSLDHYNYHDGRPKSVDRTTVINLEPYESGTEALVQNVFER